MSLKAFHVLFIAASSLIAFLFAVWAWNTAYWRPWATVAAVAAGLALIAYGSWFLRRVRTRDEERERRRKLMRPLGAVLLLSFAGSDPAQACSVCYGEAAGPMIDAARLGVWLLFGLVGAVQLAFALFFFNIYRRAKRLRTPRPEWPAALRSR